MSKRLLFKLIKQKYPQKNISTVKRGFSISLATWIREGLREPISDVILSSNHSDDFSFNPEMISKMLDDHLNNSMSNHWPLFTIYSLYKWNENRKK